MSVEPYVCQCGSKEFRKYIGDKTIYCKSCGKPAPENVRFRDEGLTGKS